MNKRLLQTLLLLWLIVCLFLVVIQVQNETNNKATIKVDKDENDYSYDNDKLQNNFSNIVIENSAKEINNVMLELKNTSDKEEWFKRYKEIIEKNYLILDPPESIYDYFSDEELELLFRVVQAEIGDEYSFEQKANVASVIFNRVEHEKFPNSLFEVLSEDQFCTIRNSSYLKVNVSETTILACEYAYMIEDNTYGSLFFDSNGALNYEYVTNDGAHNFYKFMED